jgi:hypothetical protein
MTSDSSKSESIWARLAGTFFSWIPGDMKELVGLQLGIYLFTLTPIVLLFAAFAIVKWVNSPKAPEIQCWKIQSVENRVFKLNTCTGESVELPPQERSGGRAQ